MSTLKVQRLHDSLNEARDVVNNLQHRLISAREELGRYHPLCEQLHHELEQARDAKDAALTKFSNARLDALRQPVRKARLKNLQNLAS